MTFPAVGPEITHATVESRPGPGGCVNPQPFVNSTTGEVVFGRCHRRTQDRCPSCASLYAGDVKQIVRSGLAQSLDAGEQVWLVTLTAPSFWTPEAPADQRQVHRFDSEYWDLVNRSDASRRRKAAAFQKAICVYCTTQARREAKEAGRKVSDVPAVLHDPSDPLAGLPVVLDAFDYEAAAEWNWNLGDLWHRTTTYVQRAGGDTAYVKGVELQRRGLAHVHAVFAGPGLTRSALRTAIEAANDSLPAKTGWGPQVDIQQLTPKGDRKRRTIGGVARYIAKYITKDSAASISHLAANHPHAARHFARFRIAARRHAERNGRMIPGASCPEEPCPGTLRRVSEASNRLECSRRRGVFPCAGQARDRTEFYAHRLGLRAHRLSKSRQWAAHYKESRTRPGTYLPVVRLGGQPIPLTLSRIHQQRCRWACSHNKGSPSRGGKWVRVARPPPNPA